MEKKKLPIYKLVINPLDQTGVDYVAMVDDPAIEERGMWMMFDKQKLLSVFDETKNCGLDPVRTQRGKLGVASEFASLPALAPATSPSPCKTPPCSSSTATASRLPVWWGQRPTLPKMPMQAPPPSRCVTLQARQPWPG